MSFRIFAAAAAVLAFAGVASAAVVDAQRCAEAKLLAASDYSACRLTADAAAVRTGTLPNYAKCDNKLDDAYDRANSLYCGGSADPDVVRAFLIDGTNAISKSTAGEALPLCSSGCPEGQVAAVGSSSCEACPANALADGFGRSCACSVGFYAPSDPVTQCSACPEGGNCTVPGTTCETMHPLPGYWRPDAQCPPLFYRCLLREQCPG